MSEPAAAASSRRMPDRRGLAIPLALAALWLGTVDTGLLRAPLLVPLRHIATVPFVDPDGREIWVALAASLARVAAGFALGALAGIGLGLALGLWRPAREAVAPTLHAARQVTLFAWIPLLTAWFGNGEAAKIAFIALSTFFPLYLNTEQGLRTVPVAYREVVRVARLPLRRRVMRLMLPGALPQILIGVEVALLSAWIGTIGSEYMLGTGQGVGTFLAAGRDLFRMDLVLSGVIVLALVGTALGRLSRFLFRRLVRWQEQ